MATGKRTKRTPQGSRTVGRSRSKSKPKAEPKTKPKKKELSSEKTPVEISEPSCRLEQLPVELIHMIRSNLPPESRIALALTSRLIFSIMGGVGRGTWNDVPRRGLDQAISQADPDDLHLPPRMALLTLLERDMLLLTRCDCCQILHSPLLLDACPNHPFPNGMSRCDTTRIHLSIEGGKIILPLIRAAVNWDRRGWDAGSLLDCLTRAHLNYRDWGVRYTTSQARVVNGRVLSKHEAVIFDRTLPLNDCATASGLVALNQSVAARFLKDNEPYYLPVEMPWWPGYDASHLADVRTTKCKARHGLDCTAQQPGCYLDKEVTPRRLQPYLRCLLTHKLPCNRCKRTNWAGSVPGWVSAIENTSSTVLAMPSVWGKGNAGLSSLPLGGILGLVNRSWTRRGARS